MSNHTYSETDGFALSGYFSDDEGRVLASWKWNADKKKLLVKCGPVEREQSLNFGSIDRMSEGDLKKSLISVAEATAGIMRGDVLR